MQKDLENLFKESTKKLGIKKPQYAYLLDTKEVLDDTLLIPDDSVVCISKDPLPADLGK